jgi:selenophosphate synthase
VKISKTNRIILCDAQTSGGLVIICSQDKREELLIILGKARVVDCAHIGDFTVAGEGRIAVKP